MLEEGLYLRGLVRYIHLNPLGAKVGDLAPWTGIRGVVVGRSSAGPPRLAGGAKVVGQCARQLGAARRRYGPSWPRE